VALFTSLFCCLVVGRLFSSCGVVALFSGCGFVEYLCFRLVVCGVV
jgi:hypothetical protein